MKRTAGSHARTSAFARSLAGRVGAACVVLAGCAPQTSSTRAGTPQAGGRDGLTPETAWHACFDTRSDYRRVAEYRCADGSMPLGGNVRAGGAARSGNVGAGPDGHVLDRYEVPCPEGTVVLFVDMYHCDDENGPLSEAELQQAMADLAVYLRAPEDSSSVVVNRAHRALDQLGMRIPQCRHLVEYLLPPESELPTWRALANIYIGAAILDLYERRAEFDPNAIPAATAGFESPAARRGALLMVQHYRRLVAAGYTNLQHPQLERLAAIPEAQLIEEIESHLGACALEAMVPGTRVEVRG